MRQALGRDANGNIPTRGLPHNKQKGTTMAITAYMAFLANTPLVGIDPHPAWAPQDTIESTDAKGYFEALGAVRDRQELLDAIADDRDAVNAALKDGDLEDPDEPDSVFEVAIHDDGRVEIFHDIPRYVIATHSMQDIYATFGMMMPKKS